MNIIAISIKAQRINKKEGARALNWLKEHLNKNQVQLVLNFRRLIENIE